jgi:hypothetical protein
VSGIVFVIEGVTKFTAGAWVAILLIGAIIIGALRIRLYYQHGGEQLALRPEAVSIPAQRPAPVAPRTYPRRTRDPETKATDVMRSEAAEHPEHSRYTSARPQKKPTASHGGCSAPCKRSPA